MLLYYSIYKIFRNFLERYKIFLDYSEEFVFVWVITGRHDIILIKSEMGILRIQKFAAFYP